MMTIKINIKTIVCSFLASFLAFGKVVAQQESATPAIYYSATPQNYIIGGITVTGADDYDPDILIGFAGLAVGQTISVPGQDITNVCKRFWGNGMFSNIVVTAEKIKEDTIWLNYALTERPKLSQVNFLGIKKSEIEELEKKVGLSKGNQVTPNMLDRTKILVKRYYDEKGFSNARVNIVEKDDPDYPGQIALDIYIDKNLKVKVYQIFLNGVEQVEENVLKRAMKKTNERSRFADFLRTKKYVEKEYINDKENLINKYNELGYRDACILSDSITRNPDGTLNIYIDIEEGQKYYFRNINWIGNSIYQDEILAEILHIKKGDVYNQKLLKERTETDADAVGNLYYNNGYVFYGLTPVEVNIVEDSVDLEMRIVEGPQATFNHININGNDRVYENVVRRELYTRPGELFSKEAIERSFTQIGQMGHFNPEAINPDFKPNTSDGTVDINWNLESKGNDQIELSAGWGQTGLIGRVALKFTNFSIQNMFRKTGNYRAFIPQGDGQTFSISGQTNGRYYHSYNISFLEPWLGGKRPNSLSVSLYYSKQTDVSDTYYNSSYFNNYYNTLYNYGYNSAYGYGNSTSYESFYDPDKYITMLGASIGWGKRLHWPDDYFTLYAELSYTRYKLKNWDYFLISDGSCNSVSLNLTLGRNSTDNQIFPRQGSEFMFSVSATPPYSLWDGIDYESLTATRSSASYNREMQIKNKWVEYHKWKFKARSYIPLTSGQKCLVLSTRLELGLLGHYNKYKKSPFETFYMGGDGMSGGSYNYATELVGLRGYANGSLTPYMSEGYAYTRMSAELRYPLMLQNSATIYALAFVEAGNAWNNVSDFNPFDLKRSAGVGARVFLPMIGLIGIDWAYGFDMVGGIKNNSGSQVHFVLGQEF